MTDQEKRSLLQKLCPADAAGRRAALTAELMARQLHFVDMNGMALVIPSDAPDALVLCAHFDAVPGSRGYNDNGMSLVTVLQMLDRLPCNMEVVFTNGEEHGFLGAQYYLENTTRNIAGCINLDVCGFGDTVYCDPMNSCIQPEDCKIGRMPPNDGVVFAERGIPTLTFSTGPQPGTFGDGIRAIGSTIHGGPLDNRMDVLNFALPEMVEAKIRETAALMRAG